MDVIPDEPLKNKLIRNGFWLYFFQFIVAPAGYLIKMMISRELSVEDIWLFYSILSFITIIATYNDLWLTEALQYYIPHYFIDKEFAKAKTIIVFTWIIQLISWVLISWWLYFWSDRISEHYFQNSEASLILKYFSLYFIIINLFQVILSLFVAVQNIKRQQSIDAIRIRSVVILTWASVYLGILDIITFSQWRLIGVCIAFIISWIGFRKNFMRLFKNYDLLWDKQLIKQQWTYWLRILIWTGASTLLGQINQQLALYLFWAQAAWYRTNYLSFYTIVTIVTWPIISYLFPLLNELYKRNEVTKIKLLYSYLFIWVIIFGIIWGICWYYYSEDIAILLFWESFRQSWILFAQYAPFIITLPLIGIFFQDIASRGMVRQRVFALVLWLIANIISSVVLSKYMWLAWLVYGQLIGNIVLVIIWWYLRNDTKKVTLSH